MGWNLKAYIDDMLAKSAQEEGHVADLKETFHVLRRYNMKINLVKRTVGVTSEKFLGYLVTNRRTEQRNSKP